jgi:DNA-binding MarR family transcriptional regulator
MRRVVLSQSEKTELSRLQKYSSNSVERQRSLILLLSHQGNSMSKIAEMLEVNNSTVSRLLDVWEAAASDNRFSVLISNFYQKNAIELCN